MSAPPPAVTAVLVRREGAASRGGAQRTRTTPRLGGVVLDQPILRGSPRATRSAPALLDLRPLPEPDRQRDVAGQDVVAQLAAELHLADASCRASGRQRASRAGAVRHLRRGCSSRRQDLEGTTP